MAFFIIIWGEIVVLSMQDDNWYGMRSYDVLKSFKHKLLVMVLLVYALIYDMSLRKVSWTLIIIYTQIE